MSRSITLVVLLLVSVAPVRADPILYSDDFEARTINPFWTIQAQSGSVALSSSPVQSGNQAVRFSSINTGQVKSMALYHVFPTLIYGRASVWVYDTGADQFSSNSFSLFLTNSVTSKGGTITAPDYDLGPGQDGSLYAVISGTDVLRIVDRTQGWHEFVIDTTPTSTRFLIDGQLVLAQPAGFSFDRIQFGMFAPEWRPAWTVPFDTFRFAEFQAIPEPASLAVVGVGLLGLLGARLRRRVTALRAPVSSAVG